MHVEATASAALERVPRDACVNCVGRLFCGVVDGPDNEGRGRALRPEAPEASAACPVCSGLSARVGVYAKWCIDDAAEYEYDSFLVGSVLPLHVRRAEQALHEALAASDAGLRRPSNEDGAARPVFAPAEFLKAEMNREIGKRVEAATGKEVEFQRPDITFRVDTRIHHVSLQVAPTYVRGRYRKLDRELPQTHWPCRQCQGLGCRACGNDGRTYAESVEALVAAPFVDATGAAGESFHGMGREDIDALMLGTGRPFVLELKAPRRRRLDWALLAPAVARESNGRVEVESVEAGDWRDPARFKQAVVDKTYHARCATESPVDGGRLIRTMASFAGAQLAQRTPERVAHRRADKVRTRRVHSVRVLDHEGSRFTLEIRAESGTYIKEFVSGDEGRTTPSVSENLGVAARVAQLDVVDIAWKE